MRITLRVGSLITAGVLVFGACGDGTPTGTNSGDQLTTAEVDALLESELGELIGDLFDIDASDFGFSPSAAAPLGTTDGIRFSAAAIPIDETISESAACSGGGTASVNGSVTGNVDIDTTTLSIDFDESLDITESFNDCVVSAGTGQLTLNGAPELGLSGDLAGSIVLDTENPENSEFSLAGTFRITGGIAFAHSDGRAGTCAFDVTLTLSATGESQTGTICGVDASQL